MEPPERLKDVSPTPSPRVDQRFAQWYARDFARVRRTVSVAVGDAELGEEAASEAFAKALSRWPAVSAMDDPTAWVRTVALNEVRTRLRRLRLERRYRARLTDQYVPPPAEPHPELWSAVAQLPPRSREAIALRYVADLSEDQVAAAMGISRGAVAATLSRARRRLAQTLTASGTTIGSADLTTAGLEPHDETGASRWTR